MTPQEVLEILHVAERLKCNTRHCDTSTGRRESVAEHSWRLCLFAMLLEQEPEFRSLDTDRVLRMCLIHDLGEAFTGDIPAFSESCQDSWLPLEYDLQRTYGQEAVECSPYLRALKAEIDRWTEEKIAAAQPQAQRSEIRD